MSAEAFDRPLEPHPEIARISYVQADSDGVPGDIIQARFLITFERRQGEIVRALIALPTGERLATLDEAGIAQYVAALALPLIEAIETREELPIAAPAPGQEATIIPLSESLPAVEAS